MVMTPYALQEAQGQGNLKTGRAEGKRDQGKYPRLQAGSGQSSASSRVELTQLRVHGLPPGGKHGRPEGYGTQKLCVQGEGDPCMRGSGVSWGSRKGGESKQKVTGSLGETEAMRRGAVGRGASTGDWRRREGHQVPVSKRAGNRSSCEGHLRS